MELGPLMLTTTLIIKLRKGSIIKNIQMMTSMFGPRLTRLQLWPNKWKIKQFSATKNVNLYFLPWNSREDLKFHTQLASAFSLLM